jgi:hypothetical protein
MTNSPSFLTITHTTLSAKWFRSYKILTIDVAAEFCFWTEQWWKGSSLSRPEYHFVRQLSHLSDGPLNDSKRLEICELRQSESRPVAETTFLGDHTFLYKTGFFTKFCHDLPRNFAYEKCRQRTQLSAGYSYDSFQHTVGHYGALKFCFSSGQLWIDWTAGVWSSVWAPRWVRLARV